ncbi:recombination-associated protein RdgC [uncultured Pseudomonas sp.]|uniref:recombination-associated protein RdgC n=1 Tax=uncultured Pseudomonas sp. TaxID=114707 RepID=UPI0025FD50EA|nr:recombination-associated protein RdgC [uncultured Pseudomonas sp.]
MNLPRNLIAYRLTQAVDFSGLGIALQAKPWREPATQELAAAGFIPPLATSNHMAHYSNAGAKAHLIAFKKTERILPGAVLKEAVAKKVAEIEAQQLRKVYKKEKEQIKDEVVQALLPRAFLRHRITYAYLLDGMVLVDASSAKVAEDLMSTLRDAIGSLPVRPLGVKQAPMATFTDWVSAGDAPRGLYLLDECELRDAGEDGGVVRAKGQDLTSEEIQNHLGAGKLVTKLALAYEDKLSFTLDNKLTIKRLKFEDLLVDQAEQDGGDDAHGQSIASLIIVADTLTGFYADLISALGGEELPEGL